MILDRLLEFSSSQAVNQTTDSNTASTNIVDLGSSEVDLGTGENLYLRVATPTPIAGVGTVTVTLRDSTGVNAAGTALSGTPDAVPVGTLSASSSELLFRLPPRALEKRYLDVHYARNDGAVTAGTIDAHIVKDVDVYRSYRSGYTVNA